MNLVFLCSEVLGILACFFLVTLRLTSFVNSIESYTAVFLRAIVQIHMQNSFCMVFSSRHGLDGKGINISLQKKQFP